MNIENSREGDFVTGRAVSREDNFRLEVVYFLARVMAKAFKNSLYSSAVFLIGLGHKDQVISKDYAR